MASIPPHQPLRFASCGHTISISISPTSSSSSSSSRPTTTTTTSTSSTTIFPPNPQIHVPTLTIVTPSNCFHCSLEVARRNGRDTRDFWEARLRDARMDLLSRSSRVRSARLRRPSRPYGHGHGHGYGYGGAGYGYGYSYDYDDSEEEEEAMAQRTLDEIWRSQVHHLNRRMEECIMEVWYGFGGGWDGATRARRDMFGRVARDVLSTRVDPGRGMVRLKWRGENGRVVGVEEVGMY